MFDRDDIKTETVVEALIDVQRAIRDLPHELLMTLRRRRVIYRLNLREDRAAQEKGSNSEQVTSSKSQEECSTTCGDKSSGQKRCT
jgi:hypothetical protein